MKEQKNTEIANGYKMTELGHLPKEWDVVRLGEVCIFQGGSQPPKSVFTYEPKEGYVRLLQIRDYESDDYATYVPISSKLRMVSPEDVLIARYGWSVGKILRGKHGAINVAIVKVINNPEKIDNSFLYYRLHQRDFQIFVKGLGGGRAVQAGFNRSELNAFSIPLPPLPEQRKIAAILSTVQKAIETEKTLIERTKELKKSMMQKLFTEGIGWLSGVETSQKQTEIGPIPESWEVVRLGELGNCITGTTPRTSIKDYYQPEEFDFIGPSDLGKTKFVYESINKISSKGLSVARVLPKNTVMFVCIGSTIGKTGITYKEISCTNQQINSIICNEKYNFNFVYYLLTFYSSYIKNISSFGPKNILSKGQFTKIKIPVTFDKIEQQAIVDILSTIDQKIEHHTTKKQKLEELFRTLLHELMTARVRVDKINLDFLKMEE
ncbi:MAG: restriction endonuclease subunit S [Candidatus Dojkabacteria bacterium]|nr:MAG: restriction endonuclease subunit S [Candidatus Dojkabacteria bacterium]